MNDTQQLVSAMIDSGCSAMTTAELAALAKANDLFPQCFFRSTEHGCLSSFGRAIATIVSIGDVRGYHVSLHRAGHRRTYYLRQNKKPAHVEQPRT